MFAVIAGGASTNVAGNVTDNAGDKYEDPHGPVIANELIDTLP